MPFFHDAYKGWTCCQKKSVDFTEFLNIKGCELSAHSNAKPAEPVKPVADSSSATDATGSSSAASAAAAESAPVRVVEPIKPSTLVRPDFNAPLVQIEPVVAPALQQAIDSIVPIIVRGVSAQPIG